MRQVYMFIPTYEQVLDMSPTDFELYSMQILENQFKSADKYIIEHNKIIEVDDGNYQIDVYIEFEIFGVKYRTLVECKHYKSSISREKVAVLKDKIQSTGANKGIIISTSNFQSGAIQYATKHGIALVQIVESGMAYEVRNFEDLWEVRNKTARQIYGSPYIGFWQFSCDGNVSNRLLSKDHQCLVDYLINN